jgi:hypothetical protein
MTRSRNAVPGARRPAAASWSGRICSRSGEQGGACRYVGFGTCPDQVKVLYSQIRLLCKAASKFISATFPASVAHFKVLILNDLFFALCFGILLKPA